MQGRTTIVAPLLFSAVAVCLAVALVQLERESPRQESRADVAPTPQAAPLQVEIMTNKGLGYEISPEQLIAFEVAKLVKQIIAQYDELKALAKSVIAMFAEMGHDLKPIAADPFGDRSRDRSARWTIVFKTDSGEQYLAQLNAFKAKVVVPEPPDWKKNRLFEKIIGKNQGEALDEQYLPEMYFTDSDKNSASKVARALGLDYDPPYFIAFFPKDVENELAAKERSYRNREEKDVHSTTFHVIERDGKFVIIVTDQLPIKH